MFMIFKSSIHRYTLRPLPAHGAHGPRAALFVFIHVTQSNCFTTIVFRTKKHKSSDDFRFQSHGLLVQTSPKIRPPLQSSSSKDVTFERCKSITHPRTSLQLPELETLRSGYGKSRMLPIRLGIGQFFLLREDGFGAGYLFGKVDLPQEEEWMEMVGSLMSYKEVYAAK